MVGKTTVVVNCHTNTQYVFSVFLNANLYSLYSFFIIAIIFLFMFNHLSYLKYLFKYVIL
jgi:uncharacterized membrane-anchored protein YitT (DUF2179 family)